jgi:anti-anti-sigma regulatory factor
MTVQSSAYLVDDVTVMKVRGRIESQDLDAWANALEAAGLLGAGPVLIDLDGLENWSISAQSLLLIAARRAVRRGRLLVLCRPSGNLHANTVALRVFDRVTTFPNPRDAAAKLRLPGSWTEPPSHTSVA